MKVASPLLQIAATTIIGASMAMADGHGEKGEFISADEVKFEDIIPGVVAFGTFSGDRENGEHRTFVRIPAGKATPLHTHGAAYEAVTIQGKFENPTEGNDASNVTLTAGSYYTVPTNAKHVTRCAADSLVDCISFFSKAFHSILRWLINDDR
ncbi:MAG: DUF4437 domain-containing protein [Lentilitoribacter sp.]